MNDQPEFEGNDNRRSFLKKTVLAGAFIFTKGLVSPSAAAAREAKDLAAISSSEILTGRERETFAAIADFSEPGFSETAKSDLPWFRKLTRWGQVNISEKDPAHYDIAWWRQYWKRTNIQGIIVNAGGIVAYYPSKIALHHQAEYLKGGDLFGDICKAAHADGLAVFARMDSNRAYPEVYQAHPDWFCMDAAGKPIKAADLYITCINGPYYSEHIPAILQEIYALYKPEGFTDNSWSGLGRDTICYCGNCRKSFDSKTGRELPKEKNWDDQTYKQWVRWNYDRRIEIWDLYNHTTKTAGGSDCTWSGMNSGSISGQSKNFRDFREICKRADIIMLDDQARTNAAGFQHNGINGKLIHDMLGWDKLVPESMAMYQAGQPVFRLAAKPAAEAHMWPINGIAAGIQPWWHILAASHDDRRMYKTAPSLFQWYKDHESVLINRTPMARVGVVWSQDNTDFYGREDAETKVELPLRGMTQALLRARIPYVMIHADDIAHHKEEIQVLILPNLAAMSNQQAADIRSFSLSGKSVIATGETGLYTEWGEKRDDFALADLFGIHAISGLKSGIPAEKLSGDSYHTYLRLSPEMRKGIDGPSSGNEPEIKGKRHKILKGFEETDIIPFGGLLQDVRLDAGTEVLLSFIPQFPVYPPETAWMRIPKTDIPGLILHSGKEGGRFAFLRADLDTQYARNNMPDHGDLLANIVFWALKGETLLEVKGEGMIDCHLYNQPGRLILHLVNLSNSGTWRQPLDELVKIGPLEVKIKLPEHMNPKAIRRLVTKEALAVKIFEGHASFTLDSVRDHEVLVLS